MNLDLSVVIPTMNRPKSFKQTLDNIFAQDNLPAQIIVVDQSVDFSVASTYREIVATYSNYTSIQYIHLNYPSLTKARNIGLKKCIYDIVICMDDDVDVSDDIFKKINNIFSDEKISMVAGLNEFDLNKKTSSYLGYVFGQKSYKHRNIGHVTKSMRGRFPVIVPHRIDTMWAMGFFFVVRKSLIEKWNLSWNELFKSYAYAEDLDFSYGYYLNSKKENMKCIIDPDIIVRHNATKEFRIPSKKSVYMNIFNRMYLSYKYDNSYWGRYCIFWSNIGLVIESIIKNKGAKLFIQAIYFSLIYRKDIEKGNLHYELYE